MFGERLSSLRKTKGLSQYKLAERLGFSRGQVANYEQGKREPDYETLQKIADYFEVTTDYLLGRTNSTSINNEGNSALSEEDREMLKIMRDPKNYIFFKDMAQSEKEKLERLRKIWEVIKDDIN